MTRILRSSLLLLAVLLAACQHLWPTASDARLFPSLEALRDSVRTLATLPDAAARTQRLDALWDTLAAHGDLPYLVGDSAGFLFRGPAERVRWHGSFNGYNTLSPPIENEGHRIGTSDWWLFPLAIPSDGRMEYWLEVNEGDLRLDPGNPRRYRMIGGQQVSELRMPGWQPSPWVEPRPGTPVGTLTDSLFFDSQALGYRVHYAVYTPAGYSDRSRPLPSLYVTDGPSYYHPEGGRMLHVLDNLIAAGKLPPLLVVFLDPRDPAPPRRNRRNEEYRMSPSFLTFVADELVPTIDAAYRTRAVPTERGLLGVSFGGLNAAYFAVTRHDTFRRIAMQSPSLYGMPQIYTRFHHERLPADLRLFISVGTLNDTEDHADDLVKILDAKNTTYHYLKVSDSHAWGNYRHTLADALLYLWE